MKTDIENTKSAAGADSSPSAGSAASVEILAKKIEQQETLILQIAKKAGWTLRMNDPAGGFEKRTPDGRVQTWDAEHGYNHGDGPFPQPGPETMDPELYPWKLVYLPFSSFAEMRRFEQNSIIEQHAVLYLQMQRVV